MADRKLIVHILGDDKDLIRAFRNSTGAAQKFSLGMGTILKGAVGFLAVQKGADLAGSAIRAGISEFAESAKVQAQTSAALKSTGAVANVTARQVENLAGSLQRLSGIDDELIQRGENLILTFKNVRNEAGKGNDVFNRAAAAAVDLSVAGFGSIETTAKQLGKALNDPIRGMTALARAGVTFTQSQRDQITALVEANRILDAQTLILREVESQVGGSARALGETLPGKLNILRQTFNNLAGTLISEFEPAIKKGADAVVDWLSQTKNQERIQRDIAAVTKTVVGVVRAFVTVLAALRDILAPVVRLLGGAENAVKLLVAAFVASKILSFGGALTGLSTQMLVATGRARALRLALLRLGALGVIAIAVEVIINRQEIDDKVQGFLRSYAPFLATRKINIAEVDIAGLLKAKRDLESIGVTGGFAIDVLDKMIAKLRAVRSKKVTLEVETVMTGTTSPGVRGTAGGATSNFAADIIGAVDAVIEGGRKALDQASRNVKKNLDPKPLKDAIDKSQGDFTKVLDTMARTQQDIARKVRAAMQSSQFKAIGLSATGDEITPSIENLKKQLASLSTRLIGSDVSTKLRARLAGVRLVLKGEFGKATEETRAAINELFKTIRGEFDKGTEGPLTKTTALNTSKILDGLGLGRDMERELRARLSRFNSAGLALARPSATPALGTISGRAIVVENHNTIELDGQVVSRSVTKSQTKTSRGTKQKRGPNRRIGGV